MIAYMILAHADTPQLRLLVDTLAADPRSAIFLHMDARVPAPGWLPDEHYRKRVTLVPPMRVNWAGFSMVAATLRLLRAAVAEPGISRFVLLSGTCFPVRPIPTINDRLLSGPGNHFALWKQIAGPGASATRKEAASVGKLHLTDVGVLNPMRGRLQRALSRSFGWVNARLPYTIGGDGSIVKGSQWFAVERGFAEAFVGAEDAIRTRFRHSFAPDETAFQTLFWQRSVEDGVQVSFVDQFATRQALHFIRFVPAAPALSPFARMLTSIDERLLRVDDLGEILRSDALFARKCPPALCEALLAAAGPPR